MLGNFSEDTTITSSNDEYFLGVLMSEHRKVSDHFLVSTLIAFSDLNDSIKYKDISMRDTFEHKNVLVLTLPLV
jgi:hypothetical protein